MLIKKSISKDRSIQDIFTSYVTPIPQLVETVGNSIFYGRRKKGGVLVLLAIRYDAAH
jgi:hypothetical protein